MEPCLAGPHLPHGEERQRNSTFSSVCQAWQTCAAIIHCRQAALIGSYLHNEKDQLGLTYLLTHLQTALLPQLAFPCVAGEGIWTVN